jgi:hypothetical protein
MKKINEDISRIKQVMGLLTEEESSASKFEKFANKVLNTDFDTKRIVFQEIPEPPETASREERIDYIMNNGYESTGKVIDRKSKPFAVEVYVRPTAVFNKLEINPNLSKESKNTLEYRIIFKELDLGLDEYVAKISTIQKAKLADEVRKILNESGLSNKPIRVVETSLDSVTNVISNTSELNMNNTYIVSSEGMSVGNKDIINYLDVI